MRVTPRSSLSAAGKWAAVLSAVLISSFPLLWTASGSVRLLFTIPLVNGPGKKASEHPALLQLSPPLHCLPPNYRQLSHKDKPSWGQQETFHKQNSREKGTKHWKLNQEREQPCKREGEIRSLPVSPLFCWDLSLLPRTFHTCATRYVKGLLTRRPQVPVGLPDSSCPHTRSAYPRHSSVITCSGNTYDPRRCPTLKTHYTPTISNEIYCYVSV